MSAPRLQLQHISKHYVGVKANDRVSLSVQPGQIHAILGENGAGKSTLVKIIYGAVTPDAGQILWNGAPVRIRSPHEARALGIAMVYQHFSLFDTLTAAENVWLGLGKTMRLAEVTQRIRAVANQYSLDIEPERPVHTLSVGERQRVEIVRALLAEPGLLILDEPTSVLTPQAVDKLFVMLRQLAAQGCAILYISHKLDEIRALCHHCTVLRAGQVVSEVDPRQESNASLARWMIGTEPPSLQAPAQRRAVPAGEPVLVVRQLDLPAREPFGVALQQLSLELRAGEILGVAGVSGNGQQELVAALSGEDRRAPPGAITLFGHDVAQAGPRRRRQLGLHFVPEERLGRGAVPTLPLAQNTLLTRTHTVAGLVWIRRRQVEQLARALMARFKVRAAGPQAAARSLSGGNLQKFLVGREIDANPKVLIVAQPTWGVDVGAAAQIRGELLRLREAGCALLVVSEELDELFDLSDRLVVMARGRLSPSVPTPQARLEQIGEWMSGLWHDPAVRA